MKRVASASLAAEALPPDRPNKFEDIQVSGPFAAFRHEHRFEAVGRGTRMHDRWQHEPPFGLLGRIIDRLVLARHMRDLFLTRNAALKREAERA